MRDRGVWGPVIKLAKQQWAAQLKTVCWTYVGNRGRGDCRLSGKMPDGQTAGSGRYPLTVLRAGGGYDRITFWKAD